MRLYAYPAYEEHVLEHDRLIGDLRDLSIAWTEGEDEAAGACWPRWRTGCSPT